jgi:GrpB-like predicted nucleotidyltransferase (UPF0157 family)
VERYGGGPIVVRDYDPTWPQQFDEERKRLEAALGSTAIVIEHVGSTAVPGLAAKPIIDVLVIGSLQKLGYTYMAGYETWLPGEMLFRKAVLGPWTHHVHVMEKSSPRRDELVLIRDYLRRQPEIARAYGDLKRALALVFGDDIAGFRNAKRPFLEALMIKARAASAAAR